MNLSLFEELKPTIRDKWLDYYEANKSIINKLMDMGYKARYSNHKCPTSEFIVGTVSALEPKLEEYLFCFFLVCDDLGKIVTTLELDFDPEVELKKREEETKNQQTELITTPQQE